MNSVFDRKIQLEEQNEALASEIARLQHLARNSTMSTIDRYQAENTFLNTVCSAAFPAVSREELKRMFSVALVAIVDSIAVPKNGLLGEVLRLRMELELAVQNSTRDSAPQPPQGLETAPVIGYRQGEAVIVGHVRISPRSKFKELLKDFTDGDFDDEGSIENYILDAYDRVVQMPSDVPQLKRTAFFEECLLQYLNAGYLPFSCEERKDYLVAGRNAYAKLIQWNLEQQGFYASWNA